MSQYLRSPVILRRLALTSLVANIVIVITGGAVRLTGSGLGCPTWPQCTDGSYVTTAELGVYGAIEYGNRMLSGLVGFIALAGLVWALAQRPRQRRPVRLALVVLLGVAAQGIIGGITVLTSLNPDVVGGHFLISMALIAGAYAFWNSTRPPRVRPAVPASLRALSGVVLAASAAVLLVGTLVTGSGPHAGDADAERNGLDPQTIAQVHADLVFLLLGLVVALWFALRTYSAAAHAAGLLVIILAQGLIGFVQYATHLPVILVGAHMAGACAVWLAALASHHALGSSAQAGQDALGGDAPGEEPLLGVAEQRLGPDREAAVA